jgi:hypothetical protein
MALGGSAGRHRCSENHAEQIKRIVRGTGLTMTQISAATGVMYGNNTSFFVPPTFLYKQKEGVTPHVCQIIALSEVTGYRFTDWMRICGFDLELIFALQLGLHVERTVLVTPDPRVAPNSTSPASPGCEWKGAGRRYFFAKIGRSDTAAYPAILPGSIVRADCAYSTKTSLVGGDALWLVEHPGGLACCRIKRVDQNHIELLPPRPQLPSWPLRLAAEVRVLGLVDQQLRPRVVPRQTAYRPSRFEHTLMPAGKNTTVNLPKLVRLSRSRSGLTLRAAHEMTMAIARILGNQQYGIALGQLSDYEATDVLPRHVAKVMSLCVVYGIDFLDLIAAAGVRVDDSGKVPIVPDETRLDPATGPLCAERHWEYDCGFEGVAGSGGRARAARGVA